MNFILLLIICSFYASSQNLKDDGTPYFVPQRANVFIDEPKFGNFFIKFNQNGLPLISNIDNPNYENSYRYDCIGNSVYSNYNLNSKYIFGISNIFDTSLKSLDFFAVETTPYDDYERKEEDVRVSIQGYTLNKYARTLESIKYKFIDINPQRSLQVYSDKCNFTNFISVQGDIDYLVLNSKMYLLPSIFYIYEDSQLLKSTKHYSYLYHKKYSLDDIKNQNSMRKIVNPIKNITTMLTSVQSDDNENQFIIFHKDSTNYFSVHRVDKDGDVLNEKRNVIGVDYSQPFRNGDTNDIEKGLYYNYLKASPNGKVLAQTQLWGESLDLETMKFDGWANGFEKRDFYLFKFDNKNGNITDEIIMNRTAHSMEFSPNSRYLYITSIDGMYVYDLIEWDRNKIIQSEKKVDDFGLWSTVYMGPYGKLWGFNYMSDTLLCFPTPNDFENLTLEKYSVLDIDADSPESKVTLSNLMKSGSWLPIMPNNVHHYAINEYYNNLDINIAGGGNYCTNDELTLSAEVLNFNNDMSAYWIKPNGEKVLTAELTIDELSSLDSGFYKYVLESPCDESKIYDSVLVDVYDLSPTITTDNTTFCVGDSALLSLNFDYDVINWNTGENTKEIIVKEEGVYSATISQNSCVNYAEIIVTTLPIPTLEILAPKGTILCDGGVLEIEAKVPTNTSILWNDGTKLAKRTFSESGTYTVTARNLTTGCENIKQVVIQDIGNSKVQILGEKSFCEGESTTLTLDAQAESYKWSNGEITESIVVNEEGTYSATLTTDTGCRLVAETIVKMNEKPSFEIMGDLVFCDENTTLYPNSDFDSYKWSDGSSSKSITISDAGIYNLTVTNEFGCESSQEFEVIKTDAEITLSSNNIDFGELIYGEEEVQNISSDKNVNVVKSNDKFTYNIVGKDISIDFKPNNIGAFSDTLVIESIGDCIDQDTIYISGIAKAEIKAKVSEEEGQIGDTINTIVELELIQEIPLPIEVGYNLVMEVNQDVIQIIDNTNFDYQNQKLVINIDDLVSMTNHNQTISNIQSTIQNKEVSENNIVIIRFTVDNQYLNTSIKDGKISVLESSPDDYKEAEIIALTKTYLTLKTYEEGTYKIEISDLLGKQIHIDEKVSKNETIKFNYDLINGTYFIKIIEPEKSRTIKVGFVE